MGPGSFDKIPRCFPPPSPVGDCVTHDSDLQWSAPLRLGMFTMILCFSLSSREPGDNYWQHNIPGLSSQLSSSRGAWHECCLLLRLMLLTTDLTPLLTEVTTLTLTSTRGLPGVTVLTLLSRLKGFLSTVCTTIRLRSIAHRRTFKLEQTTWWWRTFKLACFLSAFRVLTATNGCHVLGCHLWLLLDHLPPRQMHSSLSSLPCPP